jgi:glycosyltransferase involved in cell wall biosynthesis/polysaccharide pyruvyl transferase WcaK-like protein
MRLLVLNYEYPPIGGGGSPVTGAICQELARMGNHIDVVTMRFKGLPKFEQDGRLRIFRVLCLRSARHICYVHELITYLFVSFFKSLHLIRSNTYDLIHAHFILPSGVVAYCLHKVTGIPYVITAHGSDVQGYNPDRFGMLHRILIPFWRVVLRNAKAVTSPSHSLAELIEQNNGQPYPIEIIPNGISGDWIVPDTKEQRILVVSRLFRRKGVQYLLSALEGQSFGWPIDIVGDGPYRSTLDELAKTVQDPIRFHGWMDNHSPALLALYRKSSIFIFLSTAENFPISLLEAMLSGTAIIATDLAACREVLGDAALFVPPGDVSAIQKRILDLISHETLRTDLAHKARRRVLEKFTWDQVGTRYQDLFVSLTQSSVHVPRLPVPVIETCESMPRVLIVAGDIRYNLGDTAICLGVVRMIRKVSPDSRIVVWGHGPCFPDGFDGVEFHPPFSLGGVWALFGADAVLWGGGQLLQGNRSQIKILYWTGVVTLLRLLGKRIMGFAQGVGPLSRKIDQVLSRLACRCTEVITVRDLKSLITLQEIKVPAHKIFATADPALTLFSYPQISRKFDQVLSQAIAVRGLNSLSTLQEIKAPTRNVFATVGPALTLSPRSYNEDRPMPDSDLSARLDRSARAKPTIGMALRYTLHHRSNRIIPFQFLPASMQYKTLKSEEFSRFLSTMASLCDRVIEECGADITFVPMYYAPWETDVVIAESLAQQMNHKERVQIFKPSKGVEDIAQILQEVDAFVGIPMHATILSTSLHVPTLALYYEPKGYDFFQLIGQEKWTFPLEKIEEPGGPDLLLDHICTLWRERDHVRSDLDRKIPKAKKLAASNADHLMTFMSHT